MSIALDCAAMGRGEVEPNPMVGALIVRDGVEIARGFHRSFGRPHAEREALATARDAGENVRGATMYVTLEPCCHHGKTPPCTDAIIEAKIARVVIAMEDPDENVAGRGVDVLRGAGIDVDLGICDQRARDLLAAYVKLRTRRRPWVICKWAQTVEGYLALPAGQGRWISCAKSRREAHRLRSLCDGVLVGSETVLADDPALTNRSGSGKQPVRVVLDSRLRTPPASRLVRTANESPVIIATSHHAVVNEIGCADALRRSGVELLELPRGQGGIDLPALLDELGGRQWTYLLVEGGAKVLDSFIQESLADELAVFRCPKLVGPDALLPRFDVADLARKFPLRETARTEIGPDTLLRYRFES